MQYCYLSLLYKTYFKIYYYQVAYMKKIIIIITFLFVHIIIFYRYYYGRFKYKKLYLDMFKLDMFLYFSDNSELIIYIYI